MEVNYIYLSMTRKKPACKELMSHVKQSTPLFTKRTDVLLQDLVKFRSREIRV